MFIWSGYGLVRYGVKLVVFVDFSKVNGIFFLFFIEMVIKEFECCSNV